jgi:thioredoxin-related protein
MFSFRPQYLVLSLLFLFPIISCKDKNVEVPGELKWLSIDEAGKSKMSDKLYMIDVYTDWCGWCKVMDRETFSDPEVIEFLNKYFHSVKFDAEQKEPINFDGVTYVWKELGRNGINELAEEFLDGLSYPSIVYLDANKKKIKVTKGFKKADKFLEELTQVLND